MMEMIHDIGKGRFYFELICLTYFFSFKVEVPTTPAMEMIHNIGKGRIYFDLICLTYFFFQVEVPTTPAMEMIHDIGKKDSTLKLCYKT